LLIALLGEVLGWPHPSSEPPYVSYLIFAVFSAWLTFGDYTLLQQTVLIRRTLLTRHLWRLCCALFIATVIFFGGNSAILPKALQSNFEGRVPSVGLILFTLFWVVKLRSSTNRWLV
jgi:hypothetical protein